MNDATKNLKENSTYGAVPDLQTKNNENIEKCDAPEDARKKKLFLLLLAIGEFCAGLLSSIQAPFFPEEAERKGATSTEYGLVFGVYSLTIVFIGPLIGKLVGSISPKFILNSGFFVLGITSILFGVLDFVKGSREFIYLAFIIRISEGVGAACVRIASVTIVASQFPVDIGSSYAILEMCLGVAIILGPVVGGGLFEVGGFKLPFISIGCIALVNAVIIMLVLPDVGDKDRKEKKATKLGGIFKAWIKPQILVFSFSIFSTFAFIGFCAVGFEPHLRKIDLSKVYIGILFSTSGACYAASSPFWGWLNDRMCRSTLQNLVGCFLSLFGILFIGPISFIPLETSIYLICLSMVTVGFATGAKTVSCFTGSLHAAKIYNFPDDLSTYGIIASIITSSKSLGSAFGPSFGGFLIENWGFRISSIPYLGSELTLIAVLTIIILAEKGKIKVFRTTEKREKKKDSIISLDVKSLPSCSFKCKSKKCETVIPFKSELKK